MAIIQDTPTAFGGPGIPPKWTRSAKDALGTAYSGGSHIWFTVADGVISEVYYPTIDHPQIRDLQFLLIDTRIDGNKVLLPKLRVYVLLAPHLDVGGWGNSGHVARTAGREFLTANKNSTWLAFAATTPFVRRSCGYVGSTDGWQDLVT